MVYRRTKYREYNLWDLLLLSFRAVAPTALFIKPMFINSKTSAVDSTGCMLASGTANPFGWVVFQIPSVCKSKETKTFSLQDEYYSELNDQMEFNLQSRMKSKSKMKDKETKKRISFLRTIT